MGKVLYGNENLNFYYRNSDGEFSKAAKNEGLISIDISQNENDSESNSSSSSNKTWTRLFGDDKLYTSFLNKNYDDENDTEQEIESNYDIKINTTFLEKDVLSYLGYAKSLVTDFGFADTRNDTTFAVSYAQKFIDNDDMEGYKINYFYNCSLISNIDNSNTTSDSTEIITQNLNIKSWYDDHYSCARFSFIVKNISEDTLDDILENVLEPWNIGEVIHEPTGEINLIVPSGNSAQVILNNVQSNVVYPNIMLQTFKGETRVKNETASSGNSYREITGLEDNTDYILKLVAYQRTLDDLTSRVLDEQSFKTIDIKIPTASITINKINLTSVFFTIDFDNDGDISLFEYVLSSDSSMNNVLSSSIITQGLSNFNYQNLNPNSNYFISVRKKGSVDFIAQETFTTESLSTYNPIATINIANNGVDLNYTFNYEITNNGYYNDYVFEVSKLSDGSIVYKNDILNNNSDLTVNITGSELLDDLLLDYGINYAVEIYSKDEFYNLNITNFTTPVKIFSPSVVFNSSSSSESSITTNIALDKDDDTQKYNLILTDENGVEVNSQECFESTRDYVFDLLSSNTLYKFYVSSLDGNFNSEIQSIRTKINITSEPTGSIENINISPNSYESNIEYKLFKDEYPIPFEIVIKNTNTNEVYHRALAQESESNLFYIFTTIGYENLTITLKSLDNKFILDEKTYLAAEKPANTITINNILFSKSHDTLSIFDFDIDFGDYPNSLIVEVFLEDDTNFKNPLVIDSSTSGIYREYKYIALNRVASHYFQTKNLNSTTNYVLKIRTIDNAYDDLFTLNFSTTDGKLGAQFETDSLDIRVNDNDFQTISFDNYILDDRNSNPPIDLLYNVIYIDNVAVPIARTKISIGYNYTNFSSLTLGQAYKISTIRYENSDFSGGLYTLNTEDFTLPS